MWYDVPVNYFSDSPHTLNKTFLRVVPISKLMQAVQKVNTQNVDTLYYAMVLNTLFISFYNQYQELFIFESGNQ